jgi:hypothetical protein
MIAPLCIDGPNGPGGVTGIDLINSTNHGPIVSHKSSAAMSKPVILITGANRGSGLSYYSGYYDQTLIYAV